MNSESILFDSEEQNIPDFASIMSSSFNRLSREAQYKNVAIFIDYDNVYWTLKNNYVHDPDHEDPNKNLFQKLWEKYHMDNVRVFKAYADFEQIDTSLTSLQKKRVQIRHVYANGKGNTHRKNSSDIELCLDAIELANRDEKISCFVFVTADSDMIPIMSRLMYKGKRVELFYIKSAAPQHVDITTYAHDSYDLIDFLGIDVKEYNIENYVMNALEFINDWESKFKETEKFLGIGWLSDQLSYLLKIPRDFTSDLIEYLKVNDLIAEGKKSVNGELKSSYQLSTKGKELLDELMKEAASASE